MSQILPGWIACVACISLAGIVPTLMMKLAEGKKVFYFIFEYSRENMED